MKVSIVALCGLVALVLAGPAAGDARSLRKQAQLAAPDAQASDYFGTSVAIAGDLAVVGAPGSGGSFAGAAYVFVRNGSSWTFQQKLTPSVPVSGKHFGQSVAVANGLIVVGAFNANTVASQAGAVYVFKSLFSTWFEEAILTAPDGTFHDWFGYSVATTGDTILAGTRSNDDPGAAYVFVRDSASTLWTLQQKLTAADGLQGDSLGYSVALSGDTALVGATYDDTAAGDGAGSAYVFVRSGSTWTQQQRLAAADGAPGDSFGFSVALSGETALVGAGLAQAGTVNDAGAAYAFVRSGTAWTQQQKLVAADAAPSSLLGNAVALAGDTALAGAYLDDNVGGAQAGSAYVFARAAGAWSQQRRLVASDAATSDTFGSAVALSGDTALVGAPADATAAGTNAGSVHVFRGFAKGDIDADGQTDLLVRLEGTRQTDAWLMNGVSREAPPVTVSPNPASFSQVVVGTDDFDADGRNDLLFWNSVSGAAEFWLMNGATRVGAPIALAGAPEPPWKPAATADFNRDGRPDIVFRNSSTQKIAVWAMSGTSVATVLTPNPDQAVDANWEIVGAQDWNADGDTDFLWYNPVSGKIVLWFMDGSLVRIAGQFTSPPNAGNNNWKVLAMGDYSLGAGGLPGTIDIVWRNATSGRFVVWYMNQAGERTFGTFTSPDAPAGNPTAWTIVGPR
jgi:hypothetical protein